MKRGILSSYVAGVIDWQRGESYSSMLRLFLPEFISALILYSLINLLDARFIACLNSTSTYATLGVTNNLIHFLVKIAEGMSISLVIVAGQYNGAGEYKEAGRSFNDAFWVIFIIGALVSGTLFVGAYHIYAFLGVPKEMIFKGVPFLRLRALGIFCTFLYFAFTSFLRGIKNTQTPMRIFMAGAVVFLFFDYGLIFGAFGLPAMQFQGAALAGVIQYAFMLVSIATVVLTNKAYRRYALGLFEPISHWGGITRLMSLSWPLVIDKATMAWAYLWLGKMIAPMGKHVIASFNVIKDMERIAFLPAIALASIVTLLASNYYGKGDYEGIKVNIKKAVFMASLMVFGILLIMAYNPAYFIRIFDLKGTFTSFSSTAFQLISLLIFFDLVQVILAGATRGVGNVRLVMWTRFFVCIGIFVPASYCIAVMPIKSQLFKFVLIYGMFYICNAIMSVVYIKKFRQLD